jgi:hypothetical protein
MVAGGCECAGFCDDGRRLDEALVAGLIFGHWRRFPAYQPTDQSNRMLYSLKCGSA